MSVDYGNRHIPHVEDATVIPTGVPDQSADDTAIRDLLQQLIDAWAKGDGNAYAAVFTEDADYVRFDGSHIKGRHAIAACTSRCLTGG